MIFSLKILKNYIVRCDFWSWRHFVARLICSNMQKKVLLSYEDETPLLVVNIVTHLKKFVKTNFNLILRTGEYAKC